MGTWVQRAGVVLLAMLAMYGGFAAWTAYQDSKALSPVAAYDRVRGGLSAAYDYIAAMTDADEIEPLALYLATSRLQDSLIAAEQLERTLQPRRGPNLSPLKLYLYDEWSAAHTLTAHMLNGEQVTVSSLAGRRDSLAYLLVNLPEPGEKGWLSKLDVRRW